MSKTNRPSLAAVAALIVSGAQAQLPQDDAYVHMGVATCAASQCHGSAIPRDGSNVLQNEYVTWTQDDPHAGAYDTLTSDQSRRIAARLGLASASNARICLDCHADNVPPARRGERFYLSDGVGCEACHGGAENWLATHYNTPAVDHQANIAAGLYPTDDVSARVELCLSCHLGTRNKYATHRIMAAGHPRLAFELDTFNELWRTAGRQPHYRVDNDYRERKGGSSHVYTWAVGVLADARRRLALIQSPVFDDNDIFPELSFYDCHACHRSMKTVQWRPLPRHGGVGPGEPFLHDGTLVMAMAMARAISPQNGEAMQAGLAALHRASAESVAAIRAAAAKLDGTLADVRRQVTMDRLRGRELPLLREILATGAEGDYLDYISAEQAFMAVQMLVIAIDDPYLEDQLDRIADALNDDERYRPAQFAAMLASLAEPDTTGTDEADERQDP